MAKLDVMTKSDLKVISALMNRAPARVIDKGSGDSLVPRESFQPADFNDGAMPLKHNYVIRVGKDYFSTPVGA